MHVELAGGDDEPAELVQALDQGLPVELPDPGVHQVSLPFHLEVHPLQDPLDEVAPVDPARLVRRAALKSEADVVTAGVSQIGIHGGEVIADPRAEIAVGVGHDGVAPVPELPLPRIPRA